MPALNFQKQFAPKILSGDKKQTIRGARKYPIKVGDRLYLYTGMRTQQCTKLGESICGRTRELIVSKYQLDSYARVFVSGVQLCATRVNELAVQDGFESSEHFLDFFLSSPKAQTGSRVTSFLGELIEWGLLCRE